MIVYKRLISVLVATLSAFLLCEIPVCASSLNSDSFQKLESERNFNLIREELTQNELIFDCDVLDWHKRFLWSHSWDRPDDDLARHSIFTYKMDRPFWSDFKRIFIRWREVRQRRLDEEEGLIQQKSKRKTEVEKWKRYLQIEATDYGAKGEKQLASGPGASISDNRAVEQGLKTKDEKYQRAIPFTGDENPPIDAQHRLRRDPPLETLSENELLHRLFNIIITRSNMWNDAMEANVLGREQQIYEDAKYLFEEYMGGEVGLESENRSENPLELTQNRFFELFLILFSRVPEATQQGIRQKWLSETMSQTRNSSAAATVNFLLQHTHSLVQSLIHRSRDFNSEFEIVYDRKSIERAQIYYNGEVNYVTSVDEDGEISSEIKILPVGKLSNDHNDNLSSDTMILQEMFFCGKGYLLVRFLELLYWKEKSRERESTQVYDFTRSVFLRDYDWINDVASGRYYYDSWSSTNFGITGEEILWELSKEAQLPVEPQFSDDPSEPQAHLSFPSYPSYDVKIPPWSSSHKNTVLSAPLSKSILRSCPYSVVERGRGSSKGNYYCDDPTKGCYCGFTSDVVALPWEVRYESVYETGNKDLLPDTRAKSKNVWKLAVIGSHGATNMDILTSVIHGIDNPSSGVAGSTNAEIDVQHFLTYFWQLSGTESERKNVVGIPYKQIFGVEMEEAEVLSGSRTRSIHSDLTPGESEASSPEDLFHSTFLPFLKDMHVEFSQNEFFMSSDIVLGCEPMWFCSFLMLIFPEKRYLMRIGMCPLQGFNERMKIIPGMNIQHLHSLLSVAFQSAFDYHDHYEKIGNTETIGSATKNAETNLRNVWNKLISKVVHRSGTETVHKSVILSANSLLGAETFHESFGYRPYYVPLLGLNANSYGKVQFEYREGCNGSSKNKLNENSSDNLFDSDSLFDNIGEEDNDDRSSGSPSDFLCSNPSSSPSLVYFFPTRLPMRTVVFDDILGNLQRKLQEKLKEKEEICSKCNQNDEEDKEESEEEMIPTILEPPQRHIMTSLTGNTSGNHAGDDKRNLEYTEFIESFVAVILIPHIPQALRLSDMQALALPILSPTKSFAQKMLWPFAGPYCGESARDPLLQVTKNTEDTLHPFPIFDFQNCCSKSHPYHLFQSHISDRYYWYQFSEWHVRHHALEPLQFSSTVELFLLVSYGDERRYKEAHERLKYDQKQKVEKYGRYWSTAIAKVMGDEVIISDRGGDGGRTEL